MCLADVQTERLVFGAGDLPSALNTNRIGKRLGSGNAFQRLSLLFEDEVGSTV